MRQPHKILSYAAENLNFLFSPSPFLDVINLLQLFIPIKNDKL